MLVERRLPRLIVLDLPLPILYGGAVSPSLPPRHSPAVSPREARLDRGPGGPRKRASGGKWTADLALPSIADSATGELRGLRGEGTSAVGHGNEHPFALNYDWE